MRKVLFCTLAGTAADEAARAARTRALAETLTRPGTTLEIERVRAAPGVALALLARAPDAIVAVGYGPEEIAAFAPLAVPVIWDMGHIGATEVAGWLADPARRAALARALAVARGFVDVAEPVALAIEDALHVGLTTHALPAALAAVAQRVVVIMGTGLGNMIYAVPMVRWLSERLGAPIDVVVHNRFDEGVTLFARARWINAIYPGFEYLAGRRYGLMVSSITAGAWRPNFTADRTLWVDQERDYNEEGRFVHEVRLNFLGLEKLFPLDPNLMPELPFPFIRDIAYRHPGTRVVGIASGKKAGMWAKREWPHMQQLAAELAAKGWEVRSFGLPGEHVEGAVDLTGIPLREMLHRMAECAYFISYDGGLIHMAEAIGVPSVWLFGATGTVKNGPVHAHSRVLLSRRSCGPCLYKIDWVRCERAACMEDIRLSEVIAALEGIAAQIGAKGYAPAPARPDPELLVYETDAHLRPGPEAQWENYLHERGAVFPPDTEFRRLHLLALLRAGDMVGAAAVADLALLRDPGDVVLRFLADLVRAVHPGPTPLSGLRARAPAVAPVAPAEFGPLIEAFCDLTPAIDERQFFLDAGLRHFLQAGDRAAASAFLAAATAVPRFWQGLFRQLQRYLDRFAGADGAAAAWGETFDLAFERNPSLQRMRAIEVEPVAARLDRVAEAIAAPLGLTAAQVRAASFVPHLATAAELAGPRLRPVVLPLASGGVAVPHHGIVLAIVPHVMVKGALPGSTSALILQQMTRLAMIGLRPVVVTLGFDDIPEGWTMRDSVTYIQGHPRWPASAWAELFAAYPPALVLDYGGAAAGLPLPGTPAGAPRRVALDGLFDPHGIWAGFQPGNRWAVAGPGLDDAVPADALTEFLFVPPVLPRPVPPSPIVATVLLNDARDMAALVRLVTATPSIDYTVVTALTHRGIEKNLSTLPPGEPLAERLAASNLLIQFATRPQTLAAEVVAWLEMGRPAVAAPMRAGTGALAAALRRVDRPGEVTAWIRAVGDEAMALADRAALLLAD